MIIPLLSMLSSAFGDIKIERTSGRLVSISSGTTPWASVKGYPDK